MTGHIEVKNLDPTLKSLLDSFLRVRYQDLTSPEAEQHKLELLDFIQLIGTETGTIYQNSLINLENIGR